MSDTTAAGYGQRVPTDSATQQQAISFIIQQALAKLRTAQVVKVISCTNSGQLAPFGFVDVQPMVGMIDGKGTLTQHGTLHNLPYLRIQGGLNAVIIDPQPGDIGLAVFSDRDVSGVKATQDLSPPGSRRVHDLSDGFYIGGYLNPVPNQYVQFNDQGVTVADKNGNTIVMNGNGITITDAFGNTIVMNLNGGISLADGAGNILMTLGLGVVAVTGNLTVTGTIIAGFGTPDQVGLQTHDHPDPQGGVTGPPTPGT